MKVDVLTLAGENNYKAATDFVANHDGKANFVRHRDWFVLAAATISHIDIAQLMGLNEFGSESKKILVADAGLIQPTSELPTLLEASGTAQDCEISDPVAGIYRIYSNVLLIRWHQLLQY